MRAPTRSSTRCATAPARRDPQIRYDRLSGRWFVVMITVGDQNRILIAVSSGSTITDTSSFTFFQFQHDLVGPTPNADTGGFADYPSLGVDPWALYIGVNVFDTRSVQHDGVRRQQSRLARRDADGHRLSRVGESAAPGRTRPEASTTTTQRRRRGTSSASTSSTLAARRTARLRSRRGAVDLRQPHADRPHDVATDQPAGAGIDDQSRRAGRPSLRGDHSQEQADRREHVVDGTQHPGGQRGSRHRRRRPQRLTLVRDRELDHHALPQTSRDAVRSGGQHSPRLLGTQCRHVGAGAHGARLQHCQRRRLCGDCGVRPLGRRSPGRDPAVHPRADEHHRLQPRRDAKFSATLGRLLARRRRSQPTT